MMRVETLQRLTSILIELEALKGEVITEVGPIQEGSMTLYRALGLQRQLLYDLVRTLIDEGKEEEGGVMMPKYNCGCYRRKDGVLVIACQDHYEEWTGK